MDHGFVLAIRPTPIDGESFSSYISRLAHANLVDAPWGGWAAFLRDLGISKRSLYLCELFPQDCFSKASKLLAVSVEELLSMSLAQVASNFGVPVSNRALRKFLEGTVTSHLRYCPLCLGKYGGFMLNWRFLSLEGCPEHGIRLLDSCPNCNSQLPLAHPILGGRQCPNCDAHLCQANTTPMSMSEEIRAEYFQQEIRVLLSPRENGIYRERLAHKMIVARSSVRTCRVRIAKSMGVGLKRISRSEQRNIHSGKLKWIWDYKDFFGFTFEEILDPDCDISEDMIIDQVNRLEIMRTAFRKERDEARGGVIRHDETVLLEENSNLIRDSNIRRRGKPKRMPMFDLYPKVEREIQRQWVEGITAMSNEIQSNNMKVSEIADRLGLDRRRLYFFPEVVDQLEKLGARGG